MVISGWLERSPLIAILRGITVAEVPAVFTELLGAGIVIGEVPLNSPDPFASIAEAVRGFGAEMLIGAGTVTEIEDVERVHAAGGRLIVTPHADAEVVRAAKRLGMIALPGVGTATEAFAMVRAGADGLKLFPADVTGLRMFAALRAVLPAGTAILPVGGVDETTLPAWRDAGAEGFGVGSALYKPGLSSGEVGLRARRLVSIVRQPAIG